MGWVLGSVGILNIKVTSNLLELKDIFGPVCTIIAAILITAVLQPGNERSKERLSIKRKRLQAIGLELELLQAEIEKEMPLPLLVKRRFQSLGKQASNFGDTRDLNGIVTKFQVQLKEASQKATSESPEELGLFLETDSAYIYQPVRIESILADLSEMRLCLYELEEALLA